MESRLPRWIASVLSIWLEGDEREAVLGDFSEEYDARRAQQGRGGAYWWVGIQIASSLPYFILRSAIWGGIMVGNHLKIIWRTWRRHKAYSLINVLGLAIGMACFIVILLFVREELSYDRFHEKADQIYRLTRSYTTSDGEAKRADSMPPALGPALLQHFPEVKAAVRVQKEHRVLVRRADPSGAQPAVEAYEEQVLAVDPSFFEVFSFSLLRGGAMEALARPEAVLLTETTAAKYFGEEDPLGQTLTFVIRDEQQPLTVTGLVADPPANSSIRFDMLVPHATPLQPSAIRRQFNPDPNWVSASLSTFIVLEDRAAAAALEQKLAALIEANAPVEPTYTRTEDGSYESFLIEPLTDTYLYSESGNRLGPVGDLRYIYVFSTVALLILLVASINYMNLATARAAQRAREVGVRKVVGAGRMQLARQFLSEAVLMCFLALPLALMLVALAIPYLNDFTQSGVVFGDLLNGQLLLVVSGLTVVLGLLSGSYPAFLLSRYRPVQVLKSQTIPNLSSVLLRKGLVVFQFVISGVLIASTLIIQRQLTFLHTKELGLEAERVVAVPLGLTAGPHAAALKQSFGSLPNVQSVSYSFVVPTRMAINAVGFGAQRTPDLDVSSIYADAGFMDTYGIRLLEGRPLHEVSMSDSLPPVLLNETAARSLMSHRPGITTVIGERFYLSSGPEHEVVGVVQDFHVASLHQEIEPILIRPVDIEFQRGGYLSAKLEADGLAETLAALQTQWKQVVPDYPFEYFFLDEAFDQYYETETRLSRIFQAFTLVAILVACLGLFGLATFSAERRTKEIGIRKVVGASVPSIVLLLAKDFLKPVLVSVLLALPLAYFVLQRWLEDFAYRVPVSWEVFLLAGVVSLVIALLAVGYQAVRASITNPVKALRYE